MARPNNERSPQYFLILANLPECVTRQPMQENWKPVKDLIYSHIHSEDREYGRIDIEQGIAVCRIHDVDQRLEAYTALQGLSWRNVTLRAWLCEKRGNTMEQTAGPLDRRTGKVIPAPGHLMKMSPSLARRVGCTPFPQAMPGQPTPIQGIPGPLITPQQGMLVNPVFSVDPGTAFSYPCAPQAYPMSAYQPQMMENQPMMKSPSSCISRTSSVSTNSANFFPKSTHPHLRDVSSLPDSPFISEAASTSGSSSTSATSRCPSSAGSTLSDVSTQIPIQTSACLSRIKIQNFSTAASIESLRHLLQRTHHLYIVRVRTFRNSNSQTSRVFITFHDVREAEIAVEQLNGMEVCGSKLNVSLDSVRSRVPSAKGISLTDAASRTTPPIKRIINGKPSSAAIAMTETKAKPISRGPVIIDGSLD